MKKYFLVGISGISMSAIAVMLKSEGNEVKGYDQHPCAELENEGITVELQPNFESILWADEIVYSSAFSMDFPLLNYALICRKKLTVRGEKLGEIASHYEKVVAVAGSHGKSTTTAMIYNILKVAGKKPTLHLGAKLQENGKNFDIAGQEYFVTEACEYHDNFLFLQPYFSVVTNIEPEHLDYFKTFKNEKKSYKKFLESSQQMLISHQYKSKNVHLDKHGNVVFYVRSGDQKWGRVHLKIGGVYNVENALFAIRACEMLGINKCLIKLGLESFCGLEKRFERVKSQSGCKTFVDYAHHPKEISKAFNSIKKLGGKNVVLFQPHTYSRTVAFVNDFVKQLSKFDEIILFKTYAAREKEQTQVEIELVQKLSKTKKKVMLFYDLNALISRLQGIKDGNLVILGAGDLPEMLKERNFIWKD